MKKKIFFMLLVLQLFVFSTNILNVSAQQIGVSNNPTPYVSEIYNSINSGYTKDSARWWNFMIQHWYRVEVYSNTANAYSEEIISIDTNWTTASQISYTTISGFSQTNSITTSKQITVGASSALGAGIEIYGIEVSNERALTASYSTTISQGYSETYSSSIELSMTYGIDHGGIPSDTAWCVGTVGDYIKARAKVCEMKNWWGNDYIVAGTEKEFDMTVILFKYQTEVYIYDNEYCWNEATARPYNF